MRSYVTRWKENTTGSLLETTVERDTPEDTDIDGNIKLWRVIQKQRSQAQSRRTEKWQWGQKKEQTIVNLRTRLNYLGTGFDDMKWKRS
jgi:hypothetical protein